MSPAISELVATAHSPATDPHLHVWGWEIPVYLFLGGFTAGIMVLSGWALWKGRRNLRPHTTFALASSGLFLLGLATISLGMLALFLDLGHKPYVWRLYLTMKPWSPMSWGAWILLLVYPVLAAGVLLGPLFLVSGLSTAAAFAHWASPEPEERVQLAWLDNLFLTIELGTIGLLLIGLLTATEAHAEAARLLLGGLALRFVIVAAGQLSHWPRLS
jgi:formate-dependent nitrite reductase membrane component NrfD